MENNETIQNPHFWKNLQKIVDESKIIIDRPKGTHHPKFPDAPVYPLDYGYLSNTSSMDGEGIDCFVGTLKNKSIMLLVNAISSRPSSFKTYKMKSIGDWYESPYVEKIPIGKFSMSVCIAPILPANLL